MANWTKWLHPGLKLKRWVVLLAGGIFLLAVGISGLIGQLLQGFRVNVMHPDTLERWTRQVQRLRFIDFMLLGFGIWGIYFALKRLSYAVLTAFMPDRDRDFASVVLQKTKLKRGPKVV